MARRYSWYDEFSEYERTQPIENQDGIKARSQRGAFARNWWAESWIHAMERLVDAGRLTRGRSYARKGQVLSITEKKNGVEARVQGSRRTPYKITIQVTPLSDAQWEKVIDALAEQALFTAQLLAGEMPQDIQSAFQAAGVSLLPAQHGDLTTDCSCPDWANPCKHVAATHYILGERFDEDPFLLFRLRGRSQEQVLQGLRQRRAGQEAAGDSEPAEAVTPLEETLNQFWELSAPLDGFSAAIRPPAIEQPLLKRLGEPAFAPDLAATLLPAYRAISQAALNVAFGEPDASQDERDPAAG